MALPVVELHILEGYDAQVKTRLCTAMTQAVQSVISAPAESVTVMIHQMPASDYMRGGQSRKPGAALPDPKDIVLAYLSAMEAREIETARAMLGEGFSMTFPGTAPMTSLEELLDWARPRYRYVTKTYEGYDAMPSGDGAVVYCRGALTGEWPDGTAFSGIRFIDRFELSDGKITRQDVWNDIAEIKAQG